MNFALNRPLVLKILTLELVSLQGCVCVCVGGGGGGLPHWEVGGSDLASSLEAKFGAMWPNKRKILGGLLLQLAKIGAESQQIIKSM